IPEGRQKPWGTGHAIRSARDAVKTPFAAINADDFYGLEAYKVMSDFLKNEASENYYSMVGYKLSNTLSENGSVSRGLCITDSKNNLNDIDELTKISTEDSGIVYEKDGNKKELKGDETVSMNFWGFHPSLFTHLEKGFIAFLEKEGKEMKSEFFIPMHVDDLIKENKLNVKVLTSDAKWFGVTYKEDKPDVIEKIEKLIAAEKYPEQLW
nr:nucleotidyltransferase [Prolixibacteraceae bacterium]